MKMYIEFETPNTASAGETMLLYALGEELALTSKHVNRYSRISPEIVRIEVEGFEDQTKALCHIYNLLRCSKNYMAHTCFVTIV